MDINNDNKDQNEYLLTLPDALQIKHVSDFYHNNPLPNNPVSIVRIDSQKTSIIDSAGLQLILMYVTRATKINACLVWQPTPAQEFIDKAKHIGILDFLLVTGEKNNETDSHR